MAHSDVESLEGYNASNYPDVICCALFGGSQLGFLMKRENSNCVQWLLVYFLIFIDLIF